MMRATLYATEVCRALLNCAGYSARDVVAVMPPTASLLPVLASSIPGHRLFVYEPSSDLSLGASDVNLESLGRGWPSYSPAAVTRLRRLDTLHAASHDVGLLALSASADVAAVLGGSVRVLAEHRPCVLLDMPERFDEGAPMPDDQLVALAPGYRLETWPGNVVTLRPAEDSRPLRPREASNPGCVFVAAEHLRIDGRVPVMRGGFATLHTAPAHCFAIGVPLPSVGEWQGTAIIDEASLCGLEGASWAVGDGPWRGTDPHCTVQPLPAPLRPAGPDAVAMIYLAMPGRCPGNVQLAGLALKRVG